MDVRARLLFILFQEDPTMWPPEQQRTLHRQRRQDFACLALDAKLGFLVVSLLLTPYSWDAKQRSRRRRSPAGCHRVRPSAGLCCRRNVGRTLPALPRLGSPCAPSTKGAAAWVSSLCPWGRRIVMDRSSSPRTLRSGGLFSSSVSPGKHTDPCKSRACPELGDPRPVSVPPQPRFPHVESRPADDLLAGSCNY